MEHLRRAVALTELLLKQFSGESGALNYAAEGQTDGLPHYQDVYDGATPSGNSVAALNLLRLGQMIGRPEWEGKGEKIIRAFSEKLKLAPTNFIFMLTALDFCLGPSGEVVITGETPVQLRLKNWRL